jgi:hypothetical protein
MSISSSRKYICVSTVFQCNNKIVFDYNGHGYNTEDSLVHWWQHCSDQTIKSEIKQAEMHIQAQP